MNETSNDMMLYLTAQLTIRISNICWRFQSMKKASYLKFVLSSEILKTSYKRKHECQCHKCDVIFVNVNSKMCGKVTL